MGTKSTEWMAPVDVERKDRDEVLAIISATSGVTIEALLEHLPWMRWGHLFSILGECLQEGSVILCQKEFQFEVRAIHSSSSLNGANVLTGYAVKTGRSVDGYLTRS
ncbi:MAG: hypothetical protein MRJ67_11170 [Nitrospirales bacterium]|nr:hypothetical protein [Nitrospira sp.]MDR4461058.1 hypothetical protein [Nitrospirales bacterium]